MIHGTGEQCFVLLPNYYQQVQGGQLQAPKNSSCQDESLCPAKRCPAPPPTCAEEAGPSSCSATSSPALRTCEADQSDREWTAECSGRLTAAACRCHIFKSKVNHIVAMVKMLQCKKYWNRDGVFAPPWCNISEAGLGGCSFLLAEHFSENNNNPLGSSLVIDFKVWCKLWCKQGAGMTMIKMLVL